MMTITMAWVIATITDLTMGYARPSGGGRFYFSKGLCDFGECLHSLC